MPSNTSIVLEEGTKGIAYRAFYGCSGLTNITIPNSVTSIGNRAFYGCNGLTSVTMESMTPTEIDETTFSNRANATLYVPYGNKEAYKSAEFWKDFKEIVEFEEDDTKTEKIERLQNIIDACSSKMEEFNATIDNFDQDYDTFLYPTEYVMKATLEFIGNVIETLEDKIREAIEGGEDVSEEEIETLETEWQNVNRCIDLSVESIGNNRHTFTTTCNNGGKIERYETGTYIFYTPQSVDWPSVYYDFTENWITIVGNAKWPISIAAIPDEGYHVKSFTINGIEQSSNSVKYTLGSEDVEVVVEFEPDRNVLIVDDATVVQGGTVTVPVSMTNEDDITAFQFELQLPEGFSVQDAALTARRSNQTMSYSQLENGNYQFAAFSLNARAFSGNEGALVNVTLKANSTVTPGDYTIKVKNIELTTTDGQACVPANCSATLTVSNIMVGDANGDGKVSITDAVAVVNKLLGKPSTNFRADAADVTGDGKITITDAVAIVNIVLGKRPANARGREPQ